MSRIELGMIPHIVDTVIFVKAGKIEQVLDLKLVVKVPSGMNEPDLARPVVEVREFETGNLEYEIYTFGEENVVIPVAEIRKNSQNEATGVDKLAKERILQTFRKYDPNAVVKILSPSKAEVTLDESVIPRVIGRGGAQIKEIEEALSIGIDIRPKNGSAAVREETEEKPKGKKLNLDYKEKANLIELFFGTESIGEEVKIFIGDDLLLTTRIGQKARLKFSKKSELGRRLSTALRSGKSVELIST